MEARHHKRIIVNLKGELTINDSQYACFIENVSEEGIYITIAPDKSSSDIAVNTPAQLRCPKLSGEGQHLHCRVIWSYQTPPHGFTTSIGLQIIDPPQVYKAFIETVK